ncbi:MULTISPECIES: hypothetical protein [unclassified Luteococcus]|uniref:hypothetical protein n=1 Tax=unclassified Luteococcus TaxID=2639923 RepID=UPI00313CCA00
MLGASGRRRCGAGLVGLGLALAPTACNPATPPASPAASTPASASPSASTAVDLTRPRAARRAVDQLVRAADGLPVIKVDVTATTATLSALKDGKVVAWAWADGKVEPAESDIAYIKQASFTPADYNLDDVGALFQQAARISGSNTNQELQIVEYDHGEVLMTVTTRPESMPVFLRPDGSPINRLDFGTAAGFAEGLRDATTGQQRVLALGWDASGGFWADTPGTQEGVVDRRTRQARVPAWESSRKADATGPSFPPSVVDPEVLARLVASLPQSTGHPGEQVSFEISRRYQMALPVITFDVGGQKVVTTLGGTEITRVAGG